MWWKWLQTHQKHAERWKRDHLIRYMLYSQYPVRVFTPNTINNEIHTYTDVPATSKALPAGPWPPNHPQCTWGARPDPPLPAPSSPWDSRGSPRDCPHAPPRRRLQAAQAARLRGGPARCGRLRAFRCTRPMLADAAGPSAAAGTAVQCLAAATVARPATAAATSAALGSRLAIASRRPEGLRGVASRLAGVCRGTGARLVQRVAGHGHASEG